MKKICFSIMLFSAILAFYSCENEGNENETNISYYNGHESHKSGKNCMDCHKKGGEGEGWFTVAGTVYDSTEQNIYPNATIKLFTTADISTEAKYTVQVDGNGNFFTTETIDFGNGLFVIAEGNEDIKQMLSPVTSGKCNSCHGVSTSKIWTK